METTTMYNNNNNNNNISMSSLDRNDSIRKLKSSLTLDLSTTPKKQSQQQQQLTFDGGILSSPDVRMLKLATPELDRLLLQHQMTNSACGGSGGGGGSGGLAGTQIWFPKSVSEEQEAYARGFVDALLELHSKREVAAAAAAAAAANAAAAAADNSCVTGARDKRVNNISAGYDFSSSLDLSKAGGANSSSGCDSRANYPYLPHPPPPPPPFPPSAPAYPGIGCGSFFDSPPSSGHCVDLSRSVEQTHVTFDRGQTTGSTFAPSNQAVRLKPDSNHRRPKELRTPSYGADYTSNAVWGTPSSTSSVPPISFLSDTPPISPIDMAQQEAIKLARKRARNRLAATRCRNRKLERISRLQERVDELKEQNVQLTNTAAELRETINRMRQEINEHVTGGCRLLPSTTQHMSLMC